VEATTTLHDRTDRTLAAELRLHRAPATQNSELAALYPYLPALNQQGSVRRPCAATRGLCRADGGGGPRRRDAGGSRQTGQESHRAGTSDPGATDSVGVG
jgi:hypothetical protein